MSDGFAIRFLKAVQRCTAGGKWIAPCEVRIGTTQSRLRAVRDLRRKGAIEVDRHYKIRATVA